MPIPTKETLTKLLARVRRLSREDFNGKYKINGDLALAFYFTPADNEVRGKEDYQDRWYRKGGNGVPSYQAPNFTQSVDAAMQIMVLAKNAHFNYENRLAGAQQGVAKFVTKGFDIQRALALAILEDSLKWMRDHIAESEA